MMMEKLLLFNSGVLFGMFPGFARCVYNYRDMQMKMSMGHWWNGTDSGKQKVLGGKKTCLSATLSKEILHRLVKD